MSLLALNENTQVKVGEGDLTISSDYLILLLELAGELGLKQSELLNGSQLGADILMRPGISVGYQSFLKVVANFRAKNSDMSFAIVYGKRMTLSKHGALGIAARHSRTTDDAASAVTAYMSTRAEIFTIRRDRGKHSRRLFVGVEIEANDDVYFLALAYLTSVEFIIRQMLGYEGEILTRIEMPVEPSQWQGEVLNTHSVDLDSQALGAKVHFNSRHCMLHWPAELLNDFLPLFDKELVSMAQEVCEDELKSMSKASSITQFVANEFRHSEGSLPTVDNMASKLNMSAATLKRKLKSEGQSFREIKDDVLYKKSMRLLAESQQSIERIAEQLGYSDASNFAKAFKGWCGLSPSEFRQK